MTRFPSSVNIDGERIRLGARPAAGASREHRSWTIEIGDQILEVEAGCLADGGFWFHDAEGRRHRAYVLAGDHGIQVRLDGETWLLESAEQDYSSAEADEGDPTRILAPMTGTVVKILCAVGDVVDKDQDLAVLTAMKMEHKLSAAQAGRVASVEVAEGATVDSGSLVIRLEAAD